VEEWNGKIPLWRKEEGKNKDTEDLFRSNFVGPVVKENRVKSPGSKMEKASDRRVGVEMKTEGDISFLLGQGLSKEW